MKAVLTSRFISQISASAIVILTVMLLPHAVLAQSEPPALSKCRPTPEDALGPFYKPGAPERSVVGEGHKLSGRVASARNCSPIPGAIIEFWLAGPDGKYDEDHRGKVYSDEKGRFAIQSNFPPRYGSRPSHIHIRVSASGYKTLVTQYYPKAGQSENVFDLVITPGPVGS